MSSTSDFFMFNALDSLVWSTQIFLHNEIAITYAIVISKTASPGVCVSMWRYLKERDKACV